MLTKQGISKQTTVSRSTSQTLRLPRSPLASFTALSPPPSSHLHPSAMVEYVWAVHDFSPEHEDEISFRAGDRIEVVERDDQYGDGWWQVSQPLLA